MNNVQFAHPPQYADAATTISFLMQQFVINRKKSTTVEIMNMTKLTKKKV